MTRLAVQEQSAPAKDPSCLCGLEGEDEGRKMMKTLIIEDELDLLNNLANYLRSFDKEFEVLTAPSGEEGLAVLESNPGVNLLLTDVRLPGIDGIEVVRRTLEQWPDVKIVVMTAFGSEELRNTAENEGALRFIEKPVDLDSLPDTLREVHESRQRRSRAVGGLEILDVAQFIAMARETTVIHFRNENGQGTLVFENGIMIHCSCRGYEGADALFAMVLWGEGSFCELFDVETRRYRKNVDLSMAELIEEARSLSAVIKHDGVFNQTAPGQLGQPPGEGSGLDQSTPLNGGALVAPEGEKPGGINRVEPSFEFSEVSGAPSKGTPQSDGTKENVMPDIQSSLNTAYEIDGALGVALVDFESGMSLGHAGGGKIDLEIAGSGNTEVVRAKMAVMKHLGLDDSIEDILITLGRQYHLIRPLAKMPNYFLYLALDRKKGNLAMARHQLRQVESSLEV